MDKVKKLEVYAGLMRTAMESATNPHKRAFFERELKKTMAKIYELQK